MYITWSFSMGIVIIAIGAVLLRATLLVGRLPRPLLQQIPTLMMACPSSMSSDYQVLAPATRLHSVAIGRE